jgi:hypothetical protein
VAAEQLLEAAALPVTDADGERLLAHLRSLAQRQGDEALHRLQEHPLSALLRPAQAR